MASMTVRKLHRLLGEVIKNGGGRKTVCVSKESFSHPLESDGVTILDVTNIEERWVTLSDDDGGAQLRKDGTECGKHVLILSGGHKDSSHD